MSVDVAATMQNKTRPRQGNHRREIALSKIESWLNRHFLTMFVKTVSARHPADHTDLRKNLGYFSDLDQLSLDGGGRLDTSGPAFFKILQFLDGTGSRTIETLDDLVRGLQAVLLPAWVKPVPERSQELINEFFRMRATGEWAEWDRLALHILGEPMGDFVDQQAALIRYSDADLEAGGEQMFSVGFSHPGTTAQLVAFGSTPTHALSFFEDVVNIAGENMNAAERVMGCEIWLRRNNKLVFEMPLDGIGSVCEDSAEFKMIVAYSPSDSPQWGKIDWCMQNRSVMKALAEVAPEKARGLIKGDFLENDLGM